MPCRPPFRGVTTALWGSGSSSGDNSDTSGGAYSSEQSSPRRQALLAFVNGLSPTAETSSGFDIPAPVLAAIRQTVTNLLGTLPPQFFRVTISTRSDNLAQLMFSVLMTGYMFCNGWYRLQLAQSMGLLSNTSMTSSSTSTTTSMTAFAQSSSSASSSSSMDDSDVAGGTQKLRIQGDVLKWHHEEGVKQIPALEYIEQLEAELELLKSQVASLSLPPSSPSPSPSVISDELLDYLKGLSGEQVAELTDCATPDVLEAMNVLVRRLIGSDADDFIGSSGGGGGGGGHEGGWGGGKSECSATELAQLLCFLMGAGHQLRTMEVRLSLLASLETSSSSVGGWNDGNEGPDVAGWVPRLPPGR